MKLPENERIQPAAGDGGSSTKVVLPKNENIQPAAGDGGSSTKVVLPENDNPAGPPETAVPVPKLYYQRTKIQPVLKLYYQRTRESSRPPETAVPVLKLYYQRAKLQLAAGDDGSSAKAVLLCYQGTKIQPAPWRRRFQY